MTTHGSGYGENKKGVRDLFGVWTVGRSMYNTYRGRREREDGRRGTAYISYDCTGRNWVKCRGTPIHGQTEEKDSPTTFGHFGESMPCTDGYLVNFFHAEERKKAPGEQADIGREKGGPWTDYPSRPSSSSSSSSSDTEEGEKRGRSEEKKWGRGTQLEKKGTKKPTATMLHGSEENPHFHFVSHFNFFFEKSFPHFPLPGNGRA